MCIVEPTIQLLIVQAFYRSGRFTVQAALSVPTGEWFAGSETGAFKMRHSFIVLVGNGDMIQPGTSAIVYFFCFGSKDIGNLCGFGEIDGSIKCY